MAAPQGTAVSCAMERPRSDGAGEQSHPRAAPKLDFACLKASVGRLCGRHSFRVGGALRASCRKPFPTTRAIPRLQSGPSVFLGTVARTTLLCNPARQSASGCNCDAIVPIGSSIAVWQAGLSCRLGDYCRHRPARRTTCRSRFRASRYPSGNASTASAVCEIPSPTPLKA